MGPSIGDSRRPAGRARALGGLRRVRIGIAIRGTLTRVGSRPGPSPRTARSPRAAHDAEVDEGKIDWNLRLPHIRQRIDDVLKGIGVFATVGVAPLSCHAASIAVGSDTFSPRLHANSPQSSNQGPAAPWRTLAHVGAMRISFYLVHLEQSRDVARRHCSNPGGRVLPPRPMEEP